MSVQTAATPRIEPPTITPLPASAPHWRRIVALLRNPISMYTEEHFDARIFAAPFNGNKFAQVLAPDLAQTVLQGAGKDFGPSIFIDRLLTPALRRGLLTTDGEEWRQQRRAASPAFRQKALDALVPSFGHAGKSMTERLKNQAGSTVDVYPEMVRATFDVIIDTLLSGDDLGYVQEDISRDIEQFLNTIGRLSAHDILPFLQNIAPRRYFVPGYKKGMAAISRLRALAEEIVRIRQEKPDDREDLMGQLIRARDPETGKGLTPQQLVDNTLTFVGAGHETTALALTWALYVLSFAPAIQDDLAAEAHGVLGDRDVTAEDIPHLELHERVVKEAMRLFPPVPIVGRKVVNPVTLDNEHFRPGDNIAVAIYAIHRHRSLWEDPFTFNPDRFLPESEKNRHKFAYLPFGGGPRVCIGMRFALMEAVTMLSYVTRSVRLSCEPGFKATPFLTITMRPKGGMPLKIARR